MVDMFRARPPAASQDPALSELARNALKAVGRNLWLIVMTATLFAGMSTAFMLTRGLSYEAHASLMIDPRMSTTSGGSSLPAPLLFNDALIVDSEIAVLRSDQLLRRVAATLPRPDTTSDAEPASGGIVAKAKNWLSPSNWRNAEDSSTEEELPPTEAEKIERAVDWLRREMKIERQGTTYVIGLSFSAADPELAVQIVNSLAEGYIDLQTEDQVQRSQRASEWLRSELSRLSVTLADLEAQVEQYRVENDLPLRDNNNVVLQEIAEIDAAAIRARAAIRTAQAELETVMSDLSRLDDPLSIGRLASAAFGDANFDGFENQLRTLQQAENGKRQETLLATITDRLSVELLRLRDTRDARIAVAEATLERLASEKNDLEQELARFSNEQIQLRAKQREIEALRLQYASLSEQLQDSDTATRFAVDTARIIDLAIPPALPLEAGQLDLRILIAALLGGTVLGLGLVFLREQLDDRVRSSKDILDGLGLPYGGVIPLLSWGQLADPRSVVPRLDLRALPGRSRRQIAHLFAGSQHRSRAFAETLRRAASLLRSSTPSVSEQRPKEVARFMRSGAGQLPAYVARDTARFVLVTSPKSRDGKTTFTANLAAFLAGQGQSVLLVDGDPYEHRLSRLLGPGLPRAFPTAERAVTETKGPGGTDLVVVPGSNAARVTRLGDNLSVLTASSDSASQEPAGYIAAVKSMLVARQTNFDVILIDAGPLTTAVEDLVDLPGTVNVFFIARFGGVSTSALQSALRQRPQITNKIVGSFISRVKERRLWLYEPLTE